ncbi:MAG: tRNA preQ1(34) S-adenosylmethionine ribosyltransferase-isomerase QueA, partial [Betaproteobacteria bacterium]|nr:tRNA preQ1(34) S-adenosylmethionine ribosyltransferase-isomerase QueA [Betaproteobacteria bacterium]
MHTPSKQSRQVYRLSDFDFDLPEALIAQFPAPQRTGSRLMHVSGRGIAHRQFDDLPELLAAGDVLVLNDTRVMRARLLGAKPTGGSVEALVERVLSTDEALVLLRASKTPRAGSSIEFAGGARATVIGREGDFFRLKFAGAAALPEYLERHGHLPLPPYISRAGDETDAERYQTVYARHTGAVAAPTAGLHFDHALLSRLQARGVVLAWVTLHV